MEITSGQSKKIESSLPLQHGNVRLSNSQVLNATLYVAEPVCHRLNAPAQEIKGSTGNPKWDLNETYAHFGSRWNQPGTAGTLPQTSLFVGTNRMDKAIDGHAQSASHRHSVSHQGPTNSQDRSPPWDNRIVAAMTDETAPEIAFPAAETHAEPIEPAQTEPAEPATEAPNPSESVAETSQLAGSEPEPEPTESFGDLLSAFEKSHSHTAPTGQKQLQGTVISLTPEQVFLDIGYKIEGVLPRSAFRPNETVNPGDAFPVSITGRNEEGYYQLSRSRVAIPRDWSALERAFAEKLAVAGTVTAVVKGGLTVDIGVRAFMPASRSGTRDAADLEALVGAEITCRITKLDVADENVVVDRRAVLEEQARAALGARNAALSEGDIVAGAVRSLMPYGAFLDIGGVDGLLHVSDISHVRIARPDDVLTVGQQLEVKILKIDSETRKISLGLKQLQPEPWANAADRYTVGQRVTGRITRLADFGAFVEIEPGIEGLIHVSEMSWAKKVRHPSDLLKAGDTVDAVVLGIKLDEHRLSLGLKQALGDPWDDAPRKFPAGSQIEGPVTKIMNFGAFVQIAEGIEGLVHVSEIVADRRIAHPRDALRVGQRVKALVLAVDADKRQVKLSIKQLIPTSIDEYIAEHKPGDLVSGRVVDASGLQATVELGEGIRAACRMAAPKSAVSQKGSTASAPSSTKSEDKADLGSLSAMLSARWKGSAPSPSAAPEPLGAGQVRTFRITKVDPASKRIELESA